MRGSAAAETLVRLKRVERETMGPAFTGCNPVSRRGEEEREREKARWPRYGQPRR